VTKRYEVVVVGAGPAGATVARELAARSAQVLLVDQAMFPRDKPCGGGVWIGAAARLPFTLAPVTERVVRGFRLRCGARSTVRYEFDEPLALMTRRRRLDALLVEKANAAGVRFDDGRRVRWIDQLTSGVQVRFADGSTVTADAVVAADGANGVSRRALGLSPMPRFVALEANVPGIAEAQEQYVGLDIGLLRGGYGWTFPKGDHYNVGVGGRPRSAASLHEALREYTVREGFASNVAPSVRGYTLPLRRPGAPTWVGHVALVGDAAGLVDPLSGEGIGNAIHSGILAANEVAALLGGRVASLRGYGRALAREIDPELHLARIIFGVLHRWPGLWVRCVRWSTHLQRALCLVVRGELTYATLLRRFGPVGRALALRGSGAH